jgi:hypothetical protein
MSARKAGDSRKAAIHKGLDVSARQNAMTVFNNNELANCPF